ncbi:hypothetical protein X777_07631 [Ooceraea biroi]|uniref:SWIM-type domain-containing protein n=1 Tax=Ooceraea biroi TaxID=2015173 RepID=A0A026X5R7_OOCBI|nr:hypothetical protein X777_07631 [Ooceraea biroi]
MAFRNRMPCYICNVAFGPAQMARIDDDGNANKRDIAIRRCDENNHPPLAVTNVTRICINCNRSVLDEIAVILRDPACLRLNLLKQIRNNSCFYRIAGAIINVHLAPSYIQDKIQRDGQEEFQLDELIDEPGFIRVRLYSRFRNAAKYQLWIAYDSIEENEHDNDIHDNIIHGYYCTCKTGARSIGSCAHVANVLWFLGYARHEPNVLYPATSLLHNILDASNRAQPINPNDAIELDE